MKRKKWIQGNDNEDDKCIVKEHSYELIEMQAKHQQSGLSDLTVHHDKALVASINLISILSKAKTPLYLYDQITNWAKIVLMFWILTLVYCKR